MKHLKRIFENNEETIKYLVECFLDISENPNFEVGDLYQDIWAKPPSEWTLDYNTVMYRLKISLGENISLPQPVSSNLYIGMVETNLEFLKMKNEKLLELYNDIEVAIERIKDKFDYKCDVKIESNRRENIDILVLIKK
jgi:hypothetical protein